MDQNFAPNGATIEKVAARMPHGSPHAPQPSQASQIPQAGETLAGVANRGAAIYGDVARGERGTEQTLNNVKSKLMLPAMIEFFGGAAAWGLMWATKKFKWDKATTVIGSAIKAPMKALHETKVTELFQAPANYMKAVAEHAGEANVQGWAASATASSAKLATSGASFQKQFSEFAAPLTKAIAGAVQSFGKTRLAQAIPTVVKTTLGKAGGMSLFTTLMTAGVVVGAGATLVGAHAESKESEAAYKGLMADLGGNSQSGFAQAIKAARISKGNWGLAKTGLDLGSGVLEGVMWAQPSFGGWKIMAGMLASQLSGMLIPENPVLGAHVALAKADEGVLKLDTAQRVDLVKQLIAIMPSVAAHNGIYNRLVTPMAKEMVERKMSAKEVVQLLDSDKAFVALADEVKAKQARAKVKAAPVAAETTIVGKAEAANAPSMQLAGAREHQGKVVQADMAKGQAANDAGIVDEKAAQPRQTVSYTEREDHRRQEVANDSHARGVANG